MNIKSIYGLVLLHARLMSLKYGSYLGTATPRLVPGLYRDVAVLGKGERQTGRVAQLSKTGLGMWHRLVPVWTLGATDTENLVDPFVHLAIRMIRASRI